MERVQANLSLDRNYLEGEAHNRSLGSDPIIG